MLFYMAPLEGITTYVYRNVYNRHFKGFDKYFTPFLASKKLAKKEKKEVLPENNEGINLVPQILANIPDTFLSIANQLEQYGYKSVNLNLGCPSGTVVGKNRGSGQLKDLTKLSDFLDEIFDKCKIDISIKTRIGMSSEDEWDKVLELYKKYPFEELIIHPRLREDWYKGQIRKEAFEKAYNSSLCGPICYNGDVFNAEFYESIVNEFNHVDRIMIGRGIIADPFLLERITNNGKIDLAEVGEVTRLKAFLDDLTDSYVRHYGENADANVLHKMKEIWVYMGPRFSDNDTLLKKIMKSTTLSEYKICVNNYLKCI